MCNQLPRLLLFATLHFPGINFRRHPMRTFPSARSLNDSILLHTRSFFIFTVITFTARYYLHHSLPPRRFTSLYVNLSVYFLRNIFQSHSILRLEQKSPFPSDFHLDKSKLKLFFFSFLYSDT